MKLARNNGYSLLMTWLDFGDQRSKFKVIAGRWRGKGIDCGSSRFII